MKTWNSVAFTGGVLAMAVTTAVLLGTRDEDLQPAPKLVEANVTGQPPSKPASRAEATGLFVGVRNFPHDNMLEVPYAVDDAIDLAYQFSLNQRSSLVPPRRVVLALSGSPEKPESEQRLRELRDQGARVENATSGDILALLKKQVAEAGDSLFVLSIATHGFLDAGGNGYILGSTSSIGEIETSLQLTNVIDIAGHAGRSLVFVDACRNRDGQASRGVAPGPSTTAPMLDRMKRIRGQAIFFAAAPGGYAVDDDVSRNGVFTKAVLDGLNCEASAPRGEVLVETLHTFVERNVRAWFKENRNATVNPATQISMEGETRNLPLARCWIPVAMKIRVTTDGSTIRAYDDETTQPLWHANVGAPVVHAEVADLDADAFQEVVIGLRDRIIVFDREGRELWHRPGGARTLTTFTTADLFRRHTNQIVTVWADAQLPTSRITMFDSTGRDFASYEAYEVVQSVAVERETSRHAPKIAAASAASVFVLDPKKPARALWTQSLASPTDRVQRMRIIGTDRRSIEVSTKSGKTVFAFDGTIVKQAAQWKETGKRKRRSSSEP